MFTLAGHLRCPYRFSTGAPGALLRAGPGSLGASIRRVGHSRVHRPWHACCESPSLSPAPPPLHPSRSAASSARPGRAALQQRLPCAASLPCTVLVLRLPVLEGPGTICNFVSKENDMRLQFGDGLARWTFLNGHFTNKH